MNTTYTWLNGLVSQLIEGAADSFLVIAGGSSVAQQMFKTPGMTLGQIALSMAIGAGLYAAAFLKANPTPFTTVTSVPGKDVTVPTSLSPASVVPTIPPAPVVEKIIPMETPVSVAQPTVKKSAINS